MTIVYMWREWRHLNFVPVFASYEGIREILTLNQNEHFDVLSVTMQSPQSPDPEIKPEALFTV